MSRELIEFSKQIDEQFEIVITGKKGLWDYFVALFFWSLPDRFLSKGIIMQGCKKCQRPVRLNRTRRYKIAQMADMKARIMTAQLSPIDAQVSRFMMWTKKQDLER